MTDRPAGEPRSAWLRTWVKQESFWRDVAIRTIAGTTATILVFGLSYSSALILGYLSTPSVEEALAWILAVLSVVLAIVGAVRIRLALVRGARGGRFSARNVAVSVLLEALAALAMVVSFSIG